jgi:hypothetical protein
MYGRVKAVDLWERCQLSIPVDLKVLVHELGLEVVTFPFCGRIEEVIIGRVIAVRSDLSRPWFRWYVAHAIGHHVLHVGSSFHLDPWQWVNHAKAERQAEEFAAWLLGGPDCQPYAASELGVPAGKLSALRLVGEASAVAVVDGPNLDTGSIRSRAAACSSHSARSPVPIPTRPRSGP